MKKETKSLGYENHAICAECGGKCCKRMPGIVLPDDLTDTGAFEQRPAECRMLEPVRSGECIYHGVTKQEFALIWLEYQDTIEDVIKIIK